MEEIKLWELTKNESGCPTAVPVASARQMETEGQLEEILVQCPDLLMQGLKLIGRQTETPGGPLDLLGVDMDGRLVVFELKRGTLMREAVAQIIDYGSFLSELEPDELSKHISDRSGKNGIEKIDDFMDWYQEQFIKTLSTIGKPRMVLVGLGVDERAKRMVAFLADSEIDISLITFHSFDKEGKVFLAKQVEVKGGIPGTPGTKKDNLEKLQQRVAKLGLASFYYKVAAFFRDKLVAYEWPNAGGYSYYLLELTEAGSESNRVFLSLYLYDTQPGKTKIQIHQRAVLAAGKGFTDFRTKLGSKAKIRPDGSAEIWVGSQNEWEKFEPDFEVLCNAIIAGWKMKREQFVEGEFHETEKDMQSEEKN